MKKTTALQTRAKPTPKINPNAEYIPGLDDYELKPHYEIDYSKARRNPYAGRVHLTQNGKRAGNGRKLPPKSRERHTVTLTRKHVNFLRSLDDNLSKAIGKLVEQSLR